MNTSSRTTRRSRKKNRRRGAALVEFALVVQLFFAITLICIEFVRLNMIRNLVQDAAYFGARYAMVPGATSAEATSEAERILAVMGTKGATITINDGAGIDDNSDAVTVSISVPVSENALLVPTFTKNAYIEAEAEIRTERYDGYYDGT
ncbi:MAG: TadE/TadG family type IV pilus assembly protein [Planctomycetota bacterium]